MQRKEVKMERKINANDYKILCSEANKMVKIKNSQKYYIQMASF